MGTQLTNDEILATLRELNATVTRPLWLFGGVAVDFLVGRWTRPHGDIDLNTLSIHREDLAQELQRIGYATADRGWLTHWHQQASGRRIELVFLEPRDDGGAELVIREGDSVGLPGRYATVPGYLDPARFGQLEGVPFRVCSAPGEWLARSRGSGVVAGRKPDPKLEHDRRLLERLIPAAELARLRLIVAVRK